MIDIDQMQQSARCAVKLLKAMSHETRMMVLCELLRGEQSVSQLEARIGVSQSVLSQHLAVLRRYALVRTRRASQTIHYSLNGTEVPVMVEALYRLFCDDPVNGAALSDLSVRQRLLEEADLSGQDNAGQRNAGKGEAGPLLKTPATGKPPVRANRLRSA